MDKSVVEACKNVGNSKHNLSFSNLRSKRHLDLFLLLLPFPWSHDLIWNRQKKTIELRKLSLIKPTYQFQLKEKNYLHLTKKQVKAI